VKPIQTSYGGRVRSSTLPERRDLIRVLSRVERWVLPAAILLLFTYPSPLALFALALVTASGVLRVLRGDILSRVAPVDPWLMLLTAGTILGLVVAHHQDAAMLRFTGVVGAVAVFFAARGSATSERAVTRLAVLAGLTTAVGIVAVLALLRGSLPESPVTSVLWPLLAAFSVFPGVSGDTLDVNARFTVHQYGLAHLLMVATLFGVAALALGRSRRSMMIGGLVVILLAHRRRGPPNTYRLAHPTGGGRVPLLAPGTRHHLTWHRGRVAESAARLLVGHGGSPR
jgi:hypothetical protein